MRDRASVVRFKPSADGDDEARMTHFLRSQQTGSRPGWPHARVRAARPHVALALVLTLAVGLSGTTGCMVMDELDSAAAKMPSDKRKQQKKPDPSGESLGAAGRLAAAKNALDERSKKWWQEAKTLTPGEGEPKGVVRCRLPEGLRFMTQEDCLVQGGRVAG